MSPWKLALALLVPMAIESVASAEVTPPAAPLAMSELAFDVRCRLEDLSQKKVLSDQVSHLRPRIPAPPILLRGPQVEAIAEFNHEAAEFLPVRLKLSVVGSTFRKDAYLGPRSFDAGQTVPVVVQGSDSYYNRVLRLSCWVTRVS